MTAQIWLVLAVGIAASGWGTVMVYQWLLSQAQATAEHEREGRLDAEAKAARLQRLFIAERDYRHTVEDKLGDMIREQHQNQVGRILD